MITARHALVAAFLILTTSASQFGPSSSTYTLNSQTSTVTFGNGTTGSTPTYVTSASGTYRTGSGSSGNTL
jgi:hypothetical protein